MDVFDRELLRLWELLHEYKVKYILAGGFATNLHGFNRTTADMDIWLKNTLPNRKKLISVLDKMGVQHTEWLLTDALVPGRTSVKLPSGFELDLMNYLKGFPEEQFETCYKQASVAWIENIPIRFLHINHLIEAKRASNRPKDKIDIMELKKIQRGDSKK